MKKVLLGLLALGTVASFADANGYVNSDSEAKFTKENGKNATYNLSTDLKLGIFLGDNKDFYGFGGFKLDGDAKTSFTQKAYIGSVTDTAISDNTNLRLTAAYNYNKGDLEKAVILGLKEKGQWDKKLDEDENKEDKEKALKNLGFRLGDYEASKKKYDNNVLVSTVFDTDYNVAKTKLGIIYNSNNFSFHRTELFGNIKTTDKLSNKYYAEANMSYVLGKDKKITSELSKDVKLFDDYNTKTNYKIGGTLKGDVKLGAKLGNFDLSTKEKLHLSSLLFDEYSGEEYASNTDDAEKTKLRPEYVFRVGTENTAKYSKDGYESKLVLNYDANVAHKPIIVDKGNEKSKNNNGIMEHKVKVEVDSKYNKNNIEANLNLVDKVDYYHLLGNTEEAKTYYTEKLGKVNNVFYTNAKLGTRVSGVGLSLNGKYYINSDFRIVEKEGKKSFESTNKEYYLLVGPSVDYSKNTDKYEVSTEFNARYLHAKYTSDVKNYKLINDTIFGPVPLTLLYTSKTNRVIFTTNNKGKYVVNDNVTLSGSLLAGSQIEFFAEEKEFKDRVSNVVKKAKANFRGALKGVYAQSFFEGVASTNILLANAKVEYVKDARLKLSSELVTSFILTLNSGKLSVFDFNSATYKDEKKYDPTFNYRLGLNNKVEYKADENVKFITGLDLSYTDGVSSNKKLETIVLRDYKELFNVDGLVKNKDYEDKKIKDEEEASGLDGNTKKVFIYNPSLAVEFNYLGGKLLITPKVELTGRHKVKTNQENKEYLGFDKLTGKGTLKVEYKW